MKVIISKKSKAGYLALMLLFGLGSHLHASHPAIYLNTSDTNQSLEINFADYERRGTSLPPFENSRSSLVEGIKIHYRIWPVPAEERRGSVLLIHGFSGSTFSWRSNAPVLQQQGFEVIAVDVPPFGYSDKSSGINGSVTFRDQLMANWLNQEFGSRSWHLVGHSLGAAIAQAMALRFPHAMNTLVIVDGAVFGKLEPSVRKSTLLCFGLVRNAAAGLARLFYLTSNKIEKLLTSAYGRQPEKAEIDQYLAPLRLKGAPKAILAVSACSHEVFTVDSRTLSIPVLAIWGEKDTWVPLPSRKAILDKIPDLKLEVIGGAGHNPMETHEKDFNRILLDFLKSDR